MTKSQMNIEQVSRKKNLKGMSLMELEDYLESLGKEGFRGRQIFAWIYQKNVDCFHEMTSLSKPLRDQLVEVARVSRLQLMKKQVSTKDKTIKFLFGLDDGCNIESVLMFERDRKTLCISTQVGCAVDCGFCATGKMGLRRHLTPGEITDQLLTVQKLTRTTVTNLVCMGMGEPFHNYANLMKACALLSHRSGIGLRQRSIVVSTSGIVPKIYEFADERHKYRLAISLNATTDETRSTLMPLNRKWPIDTLLKAARYYTKKAGQPVTIEYVLMDGITDSPEDAIRLLGLVRTLPCKVNLIPYNATIGKYRRSPDARIQAFYRLMAPLRAPVTIRWSKGSDIQAACGQLASINPNS